MKIDYIKEHGLTTKEVLEKQKDGKNELPKGKKESLLKTFINQFFDSIILIMIVACIISLSINEIIDAVVILFIILLDVVLGTFQEWKAGKNTEALENIIKVTATVLRNGKEIELDAVELVVGDVIFLQSGDRVPADAIILSCNNFTIDESALTGESIPNHKHVKDDNKDKNNLVYAGTNVMTGRAKCIITGIGANTEIGKIATEVSKLDKTNSPLAIRINKFSKQISVFILIISLFVVALLFFKGFNFSEIVLSVVALTVSSMPEGLPLALTLALTIGSNRMAKKNIIVKKLKAVESLGSCTIIASDKTGTLTVNEQTAKKIILPNNTYFDITGTGYNDEGEISGDGNIDIAIEIAKLGVINNEAVLESENGKWTSHGDSIDIAFLALGKKLKINNLDKKIIGSIPYESESKYSAVFYKENKNNICTVKGSLETVFEFCDYMYEDDKIVKIDKNKMLMQNEKLASDGYRIIAIAKNTVDNFEEKDYYDKKDIPKLIFCGLVAFIDPIRKEAASAIKKCRKAGISVVMITGDHMLTAYSIAKELGLASSIEEVTVKEELEMYMALGEEKFDEFIRSKKVFTRITPKQKFDIVESFKRQGEFIAVTGDGVNDAPALKAANIGIAMGSGTDVAKETSTMIITDDNFLSIVSGIEEGRNAYANIRKVIYLLISCGVAEVLFFIISIMLNMPMPLIAIQLIWLNVVTDGFQDLALSFEKLETGIMKNKPRRPNEPLFDRLLIEEIALSGLFIGITVFIVWFILINILNMETTVSRGYIMTLMVFMQNIHVLNCRSETEGAFKISLRSNPYIIYSILSAIILQVIIMEVPFLSSAFQVSKIPFSHIFILFIIALPTLFIMELFKKIKKKELYKERK